MSKVIEFIQGQEDCKNGVEHKSSSEDYTRGYAAQYALEAVNNEMTSELNGNYAKYGEENVKC